MRGAKTTPVPKGLSGPSRKAPAKSKGSNAVDRVSVRSGLGPKATSREVSIRQIENGFIVTESTYGPRGYKSTERFEAKPPTVKVEPTKGRR